MQEINLENASKYNIYLMASAALLLGGLFDLLFFEKNAGISVFIFEATAVALTLYLATRFKKSYRNVLWLLAVILFFAAMPAIRDNMFLTMLNVLASAVLVLLTTGALLQKDISKFRIPDYFFTVITTPFKILRCCWQTLSFATRPSQKSSTEVLRRVVVGIVLALPFLLIFGALFASADLAFKQLIDSIFRFQISDELVGHLILIVGTFVVALGLFAYLFNIPPQKVSIETAAKNSNPEKPRVDRNIEVRVFLWLIVTLFAVFLIFQVAYLFGGAINIREGAFTFAEYARKGFGELLVVAAFSLVLLLVMDRYTKSSSSRFTWFTLPSLILSAEIFIIIISAFKRLMLYETAYGLTAQRLYAGIVIILLAVIFIILAFKLWREKEDAFFAFAAFLSFIACLLIINLINPDALIVQRNIKRFDQTGKIDVHYLGRMSADAVPAILSVYNRLSDEDKVEMKKYLDAKEEELENQKPVWQSYSFSRDRALEKLQKTEL